MTTHKETTDFAADAATEKELSTFFAHSRTQLVNFAQSFVRDRGLCEDIVAEVYIQVASRMQKGKGPTRDKLEPYVKVCIRNEAFRQGKRHAHEIPTEFIDVLADEMTEAVSEADHDGTWDEHAAARAFQSLSSRSQSILRLATVEGRRVTDISSQLGISERAVVSAAFRARQGLRTRYLVEVTAATHSCRDTNIEHLASYARDQAPARRAEKIEAHIQRCSSCNATVRRMRALRLPTLVIVGLAATSATMFPLHSSSAQAAEATGDPTALSASHSFKAFSTRGFIGIASVAALLAAAVLLLVLSQPEPSGQTPSETAASQPQEEQQADRDEPSERSKDTTDEASDTPTDTQQSTRNTQEPRDEEGDPLPDGIHSVDWSDPPDNYVAGGQAARLLLSVSFDQSGSPENYRVTITLPDNATLSSASAGCTANGAVVQCEPSENLVPTDVFRWQFILNLGNDFSGDLPEARIEERDN
jgi:RNA polymerase sigma-70 factor (ECF subfamily)